MGRGDAIRWGSELARVRYGVHTCSRERDDAPDGGDHRNRAGRGVPTLRVRVDPGDRRYGFPFICCTTCGPRYSVVCDLPYDRANTTMAAFELCAECRAEYEDPTDRRFHAQATSCPRCGPQLTGPTIDEAVAALVDGSIVAVKGLGGYQLLCRADRPDSVQRLRDRKHRESKPFALLVDSMAMAEDLVILDPVEREALESAEAPIVLAQARPSNAVAEEVAPGTRRLGVMLPASNLHALLASGTAVPLVCTSGNRSNEPIVVDDDRAATAFDGIVDLVLAHDRRIERRADDSVGQVVAGEFQLLRRARGYAPRSVPLLQAGPTVLGVGAELKSTTCLAVDDRASLSVHLGDLESPQTLRAFEETIADQIAFAEADVALIVHDLHPEYLSTKFAVGQDIAPILGVQHHHAHLVSCLVENGHEGPAVGVIFDGFGWGEDGTAWGGEFLVGDARGYERAAFLQPVALPGGAKAIREPWRMAVAHCMATFGEVPSLVRNIQPLVRPGVTASDPCILTFTGGTTGKPKGVILPHRSWAELTAIQLAEWELPDELRMLVATPLSHAAMTLLAPVLLRGGAFHVMDSFTPQSFFDAVEQQRITATLIVPVMLYALQADDRYSSADMSSMETILYGASPMSPAKLSGAIERWGSIFFQFYGQTEAPMVVAHMKRAEHDTDRPDRLASCGRPAPWVQVSLRDSDNVEVAHSEPGEICVRSRLVMDGYKDEPEQTAETLAGGWLHTGDIGRFDDDGFLHIVGRSKDMIITGSFNVYPSEVEDVISAHPSVSMVMVIGVPDEKWGEAVKAVVVLRPEFPPTDELANELQLLVKEAKGSQQSPKTVDFVDEVPLTAVGKPDKNALRAVYWREEDRDVS